VTKKDVLNRVSNVLREGPFKPTWESLADCGIPRWYSDAKFGIFIHWGVYCVPAYGSEWYPHFMYEKGHDMYRHHVAKYGPHSQFGYKDFVPRFRAERFDPASWADLFKKAGARYVVPVAEHHDGFAMYASSLSRWNSARMGPCRDVVGELAAEVRKRGITFGVSSHRAEHWWFMHGGTKFESDVNDPLWRGFYGPAMSREVQPDKAFLDDWLARCCELVDKYRPQVFWFDWWIEEPAFQPCLKKFAAYYYNRARSWKKGVAINFKNRSFADGTAVLDLERGQLADVWPVLWQNDTGTSRNSWGYIKEHDYKTAEILIGDLVDVASKNGVFLLNVGPKADGTIPQQERKLLLDIGKWLAVNGEAIYGTRPWRVFGEGPTSVEGGMFTDAKRSGFTTRDVRFTTKGNTFYAIAFGWPDSGKLNIKSFAQNTVTGPRNIRNVSLLGSRAKLEWKRTATGLVVHLPKSKPCDHAYVLKLTTT
jgi:alpha-L-fucosidase